MPVSQGDSTDFIIENAHQEVGDVFFLGKRQELEISQRGDF
jgi:hypothetical protein